MYKEYLVEPFLTQYFLLEAVCDDFITEKQRNRMFQDMSSVFCLDGFEDLEELRKTVNLPHFREITNIASYERLCRTIEFAERSGQKTEITALDRMIMAQKREAMQTKAELFKQAENLTEEKVSNTLLVMAMNGNVDAMVCLAYLEYHGIGLCKDVKGALKRIRLCAKWNSLAGNLLGIAYDGENRCQYFDILYSVLRNAGQKKILSRICSAYGCKTLHEKNHSARIIEKAFGLGIIRRNYYDSIFAKVAFSEIISVEDKEKLLLSKQKDAAASLSDIPFDVDTERKLSFNKASVSCSPIKREAEITRILQNMAVMENCSAEVYAPLMIVAPDEYVSEAYKNIILRGFSESSVIEIDGANLTERDFYCGSENLFLRSLSETKNSRTVFVIHSCDEMSDACTDEMAKLLDYNYRKKFRLFHPPVSLDLSGMVFVLFAKRRSRNVKSLAEYCDTVWAANTTALEKNALVDSLFKSRAKSYGCDGAELEEGCVEYLVSYDAKRVQQILDSAFRSAVYQRKTNISLDALKAVCESDNPPVAKRGFGYIGGSYREED